MTKILQNKTEFMFWVYNTPICKQVPANDNDRANVLIKILKDVGEKIYKKQLRREILGERK